MSDGRSRPTPVPEASANPVVALAVEDEGWPAMLGADPEPLVREALEAVLAHAGFAAGPPTEISVTLAGDAAVHGLNREWRGRDKPTNLLSFPMAARRPGEAPGPLLGDLVLARETCAREAAAEGKPPADHFRHLLVHGTLHLLGHDHEEDREADAMEALEIAILAGLGIPDPYADDEDGADDGEDDDHEHEPNGEQVTR